MELLDRYQQGALDLIFKARTTQRENVIKAGNLIADAVIKGGKIYLGRICHDIESDLLCRGGGPIFYQHYENAEKTPLNPGDVYIVGSVSGRSKDLVDLAYDSVQKGVTVIALTSLEYAAMVEPVHESGKKLHEIVTLAIDNCAPAAEAMLDVEGLGAKFAATSGFACDFLMWSITAVAVERLMQQGITPGVYRSANFPGGMDFNNTFVKPNYGKYGW